MSSALAPIVLFVYNRPEHTRRTVEALSANRLAPQSRLIVFSDGPRNDRARVAVEEVRRYVDSIEGFASVETVKRERNQGLAASVISGVTRVVEEYGRVIVLEDDLITSPYFLDYMNEGLELYQDDKEVASVQAHMFPLKSAAALRCSFFLPFPGSWGWGVWSRSWCLFNPDAEYLLGEIRRRRLSRSFDLDRSYPYTRLLEQQVAGRVDSWAIRWYASLFLLGKKSLFPYRSFVVNIGFDGSGRHCGSFDAGAIDSTLARSYFPITVCSAVVETNIVDAYIRALKSWRTPALSRRLMRRFKTAFVFIGYPVVKSFLRLFLRGRDGFKRYARRLLSMASVPAGCRIHRDALIGYSASLVNLSEKETGIQIGAFTVVKGEILTLTAKGEIDLGEYCYVGENARIWSAEKVSIGDRVLIAHDVNIFDNVTHPEDARARHEQFKAILTSGHPKTMDLKARPVTIKNDAWIAAKSVILPGVTIGEGAVVGAGSVVTKDVPPYTLVAGNPARPVRPVKRPE